MNSETAIQRPKILQLGTGPTASRALEALVERFDVVGFVRESHPESTESDQTVQMARTLGVPTFSDVSQGAINRYIDELGPDCVVVSSHRRILPPKTLSKCRFVNVHYAPLPRYRGRANVNWAIINGERSTGITIHTIQPGLDEGEILYQESIEIGESDDVAGVYDRLNSIQRNVLAATVQRYLDGDRSTPQDHEAATYCCSRNPEDGEIDWSRPVIEVHRLIRALVHPYPGAFTYYEGRRLTVHRAEVVASPKRYEGCVPGRVVAVSKESGSVEVLAGEGILRLIQVQWEGEAVAQASDVIRTVRGTLGLRNSDLLARIEFLERLLIGRGSLRG